MERPPGRSPSLATIAGGWGRIGLTGFGGPPAHIALLRRRVVDDERWIDARTFEDANAACGLLPGPASTELAIYCAYRVGGPAGALVGGLCFIVPAVVLILALSVLFLAHAPPLWVRGAGAGAGAAVPAVAVQAARSLMGPSWLRAAAAERDGGRRRLRVRWVAYVLAGATGAVALGPFLVLVLIGCGLIELAPRLRRLPAAAVAPAAVVPGGLGALAWTAFKVGALTFGGGFVIVPLMQSDAVHTYHWMSNAQFLNAVALGQVTPGPVVATVAAVGYAAHGLAGGLLAAAIAFTPAFSFILIGGRSFERLRTGARPRAFLDGAGPAAIGAILGAAVLLAGGLRHGWQFGLLAAALGAVLVVRLGVVVALVGAGVVGVVLALAGVGVG